MAGVTMKTMMKSIGRQALRLSIAVVTAILGIYVLLPVTFALTFDHNLSHYPAAAALAQRDPELRYHLLVQSEIAYIRGGWRAANMAVDAALASLLEVYADDEHVLAMARGQLRVLDKLKATPSDCKAFLLAGSQGDDFQAARPEINEAVAAHKAAFQNGFDRRSQGVTWSQPLDSTILYDDQQLAMQPLALSPAELQALAKRVNGDATQLCSGSIKRLKNLLARDPSEAARIEREHIQFTDRVDWVKVQRELCRQQREQGGEPGGFVCTQAISMDTQQ
jgi:hypothetical protein